VFGLAETADIAFGKFLINHRRRVVTADGEPVPLQQRTFDLLVFLVAHRERVVSRDEILAHVFGGQSRAAGNVPVQVHNLRRAITRAGGDARAIQTVGQGYRFIAEAEPIGEAPSARPVAEASPEAAAPAQPDIRRGGRPYVALLALALVTCMATAALWGIRGVGVSRRVEAGAVFAPPPHSVAVLAFTNMSGDPNQDDFADGLAEELINALSQVRELRVAARTSSFTFKDRPATIADIAHALNVGAVLQGSVRRQNHHLRISVQLTDATTGYEKWTHNYDCDESDLLAVQGEIAADVTGQLQVQLLGETATDLTLGGTANADAFDHYLKAVQLRRQNKLRDAMTEFGAAIALDPHFAFAHSGLAEAALRRVWVGHELSGEDPDKLVGLALASAERAVSLAPTVGLTHAVRAQVLRESKYDLRGAMKEVALARSLTPGDASVELIYGQVAGSLGRAEEALAAYRHAVDLDPLRQETWAFLGFGLMATRQYEASLAAFRHGMTVATGLIPEFVTAIGFDLVLLGKPKEAIKACAGDSGQAYVCLAIAYHANGQQPEAEQQAALYRKIAGTNDEDCNLVMIYAQWGRTAEALRIFQELAHDRDSGLNAFGGVKSNPFLDPLRNTPQFQAAVNLSEQPL
jgi:TolB-like protein/DNA-binding winged helix-turn-helix (wHTH) protein